MSALSEWTDRVQDNEVVGRTIAFLVWCVFFGGAFAVTENTHGAVRTGFYVFMGVVVVAGFGVLAYRGRKVDQEADALNARRSRKRSAGKSRGRI